MLTLKSEPIRAIEKIVMETAGKQKRDFTYENRIIFVYSENEKMQPRECAKKAEELFNCHETGDSVINTFKRCRFGRISDRENLFCNSRNIAIKLIGCLNGDSKQIADINDIDRALETDPQAKRITLNNIYRMIPELQKGDSFAAMLKMNKDFAGESLDGIISYIKLETGDMVGAKDYEKEIYRLEADLSRANRLLVKLQDDFEERIEENRRDEQERVVSMLNSPNYGYILDMITILQSGLKVLRRTNNPLPYEINILPSLVRRLLQFVGDCGITPIMELGEEFAVTASDMENYIYQGTPSKAIDEVKTVKVVATGWEIKDKEFTVSLPTVQEKE